MTLQEAEIKLTELNDRINSLLEERETVLKEWSIAFNLENSENIICVDENEGDCHDLYLVNGDFKMHVCRFNDFDLEGSIDDFYRKINNTMHLLNSVNKREFESPDYQKNLVYAKAIEIRENYQKKMEEDAKNENIASSQDIMAELRKLLSMRTKDN